MGEPGRTTFLALALLHDAIERSRSAPLKPEPGVRLALAYLWSITLSKNRDPFDSLWRTLLGKGRPEAEPGRVTWCGTHFASICREVRVKQDMAFQAALAKARVEMMRPANDRG